MVSIGLGRTGRARLQINRDQRQQQSQKIRKIVSGFREQRERMGANDGHYQQYDVGRGHAKRDFQVSLRTAGAVNVAMHLLSVYGCQGRASSWDERGIPLPLEKILHVPV